MKIAVLLSAHNDIKLVQDTLDSVKKYMTNNILVMFDGAFWSEVENINIDSLKMKGMYHKTPKAPYRNIALGLQKLYELFPDCDWYNCLEYDCLVASSHIKTTLEIAKEKDIWFLGNDGKIAPNTNLPFLDLLLGGRIDKTANYYALGCCQFYSKKFIDNLIDRNFFEKFLNLTNYFTHGFYPFYNGYDISEHLYPTLARVLGGKVAVLASRDYKTGKWHGNYERYPMRWLPEIDISENYPEASILHPIKSFNHPIRKFYRKKRNDIRNNS